VYFVVIYAFFGVNFILQKFYLCKKNDKYEVCLRALYPSAGHCESKEVQVELEHGSVAKLLLAAVLLGVHVLEHQHEVGGKGG